MGLGRHFDFHASPCTSVLFTGGLAEARACPGVKIIAMVDGEFDLSECWAATVAFISEKRPSRAGDAIGFANVPGRFSAMHVQRKRLRIHVELQQW
jgi:hypothetical protein